MKRHNCTECGAWDCTISDRMVSLRFITITLKKKLSLSSKGLNLLAIYKYTYLYTFYILLYRFIINCILACQKNILVLSGVRSIIQRNEKCVNVKE